MVNVRLLGLLEEENYLFYFTFNRNLVSATDIRIMK